MATKTISLHIDAYERLVRARRNPVESFSQVVLRAEWPQRGITGADLLDRVRDGRFQLSEAALRDLEDWQVRDLPAEDKWRVG